MIMIRQQALHEVLDRVPNHQPRPANKISEYFGENVFNLHVWFLPARRAYDGILEAMERALPSAASRGPNGFSHESGDRGGDALHTGFSL